jgi:protein TonB
MDSNKNFLNQSMDDIVFDNRNKGYGAFDLRNVYEKHLMKALLISVSVFVFSLYTPKIANTLGLFAPDEEEQLDTTIVDLIQPPSIKEDETPPPPPPEPVEVQRPTEKFLEMLAVKKEDADKDPPPTVDDLKDKEIGDKKIEGDPNAEPVITDPDLGTGDVVDPDKLYQVVDQQAEFIGGQAALTQFLEENLNYPEGPKSLGIAGVVQVYFVVSIDGKVADVSVLNSSGDKELDAEAIRVVRKCSNRFKPAKVAGKSVKAPCRIPITFEIDE